jgi:hypothetical protein
LILDNFGIVGFLFFGRIPVDSSLFILIILFILNALKRSLILAYGPTECSVLNITLLVGGNAGSFICIGYRIAFLYCVKPFPLVFDFSA